MCNKNTLRRRLPDHHHHRNQVKRARKSRTKTRKPKFLSLSKQLKSQTTPTPTPSEITEMTPRRHHHHHHHHQLNLFPLHPENVVSDDRADENAALLFNSEAGSGGASLSGLLHSTTTAMSSEEDSQSYAYREEEGGDQEESLVKTAMRNRNRERDLSEEKWVCYSEVVEKKELVEADQEVTSSSETTTPRKGNLLSLKLDYQGILNAWSDKGSLYIHGSDHSPQTVPDLHDHHDHFFASDNSANALMDGWGNAGNLWKVPERVGSGSGLKIKEETEGKDGNWKTGQREASVLRYKEKRQSRLFAKRIRYEVRKLNAEKRPRMKGRFVKIS